MSDTVKLFRFDPQGTITVWELAQVLRAEGLWLPEPYVEKMPLEVQRHFVEDGVYERDEDASSEREASDSSEDCGGDPAGGATGKARHSKRKDGQRHEPEAGS